jgi:hypothetical protein
MSFVPPVPLIHLLFSCNPQFEFRVYVSLREIIDEFALFDRANPEIFVFDGFPPLRAALGTPICMLDDLRCLIRQRLGFPCTTEHDIAREMNWLRWRGSAFVPGQTAYPEGSIEVSESLRRFLAWRGLPGPTYTREVIAAAISSYVFANRNFLVHPLDSNVILCRGDPLSLALGVENFHYSRLPDLISCHVVVEPEEPPLRTSSLP